MPHHSYLVESGLPVEDGEVPIPDVPLHLVPTLQVEVTALWVESQVNPLPRVPDDVLGLRVLATAPPHQGHHLVYVEGGHYYL